MIEEVNQRERAINLCKELAIPENEQVLNVIVYALEKWPRPQELELRQKLTAIAAWLDKNQPDVFKRGLWDAINEAVLGATSRGNTSMDSSQKQVGRKEAEAIFAYLCPVGCGCLWRDNKDGTMSLFGPNSKSCATCEVMPLGELIPLKRIGTG